MLKQKAIQVRAKRVASMEAFWVAQRYANQDRCRHPAAVKTPKASEKDTGSTHYWYDIVCPDCGKRWLEDQ